MAILDSLLIAHYKGFFDEQLVEFAKPNGEENGSGLTLIVGPNNAGKTALLEALLIKDNGKFKKPDRHDGQQPKITIKTENSSCTFTNIDNGSEIKKDGTVSQKFEVIQSRRHWQHYAGGIETPETFAARSSDYEMRNASGSNVANVLKSINKNPTQKEEFNKLMRKFIPHFTDWTIDANDEGRDYVVYKSAGGAHHANILGDGVVSLFRICAHLVSAANDMVLVIDEPGLSLHPPAQKQLSRVLSERSKQQQIILCTHSTYFANWQDFINGAKFVRLNKINDIKCEVFKLNNQENYAKFIGNNISEWQKPQMLDIVAKEILFTEKILFVEGQEDVGLIRKWLKDNGIEENFDIFGYGVGGYANMEIFLTMAKDLGLHKVAALYDSGKDADTHFEKDKQKYSEYWFEKLPTTDIRDKQVREKPAQCFDCPHNSLAKIGVFDQSGNVKPEYKEKMNSIMNNIIKYFNE